VDEAEVVEPVQEGGLHDQEAAELDNVDGHDTVGASASDHPDSPTLEQPRLAAFRIPC
jgi:hypothetical protein